MPVAIYTNFAGGVNNQLGPVVPDNGDGQALLYCDTSVNWENTERGLRKQHGYIKVFADADVLTGPILGDFEFRTASGTLERIVCANGHIYRVISGVSTSLLSGQDTDAYYTATPWDNGSGTEILLLMNGVNKVVVYDGATAAAISVTDPTTIWDDARPAFACVFRGNLFYGGDPTNKYRIYKPRPGTYNNFDNTTSEVDAFDVDAGFGGKLTGLKALTKDFMVVYKENVIRRLSGTTPFGSTSGEPFQIQPVTDSFGCIAPRTLVGNEVEHYFWAEDGLRQLRPIQSYGDIDPQQPTWPVQDIVNSLNQDVIQYACATFDKNNKQIVVALPASTSLTNNKVLYFDIITRAIWFRGDDEINASTLAIIERTVNHGDYDGQLYTHSGNSYAGAVVSATWRGKLIAHMGVGSLKIYRDLVIYADADASGDLITQWSILSDEDLSSLGATDHLSGVETFWDEATWDVSVWSGGGQRVFHFKNLGKGNAIALSFANTSSSQSINIRQVEIYYDVCGKARG